MAELCDVEALAKISTVVDESQIKIILSRQCLKAQASLVEKLKKESNHHKETCSFHNSANLKLECELKQAAQEIRSLLIAQETIRLSNIELRKELLLAKEKKLEIVERVQAGEKKYETLWLECKNRYESIPFVQKLIEAKTKIQTLKDNIDNLESHTQTLLKQIETKRNVYSESDRIHIIELAQYLVHEMPNGIKIFKETASKISGLTKEIDEIIKEQDNPNETGVATLAQAQNITPMLDEIKKTIMGNENWINLSINTKDENIVMPKLQLLNDDLDAISDKLEQIKMKKVDMQLTTTPTKTGPLGSNIIQDKTKTYWKEDKIDEYISSYFNNPGAAEEFETKSQNYSKMKLINILEDIQIDKNDAVNIVAKANLESCHSVNVICADIFAHKTIDNSEVSKDKNIKIEVIEEVDLSSKTDNILIPPTQFLDMTMDNGSGALESQKAHVENAMPELSVPGEILKLSETIDGKKRISFDTSTPMELVNTNDDDSHKLEQLNEIDSRETKVSELDKSVASEENFMKIKDMILRKHNLDCSPEFVYTKNATQMKSEDKVVTSKFFSNNDEPESDIEKSTEHNNTKNFDEIKETSNGINETDSQIITETPKNKEDDVQMEDNENVTSIDKPEQPQQLEKPASVLFFTHGAHTIPDSLDMSISTTGYEDSEADFPHCIDSSLLLSPKADIPMPLSGDNSEIQSQEVPNFLSGIRKTGLSLFGFGSSESRLDANQNQGNNFSFNFGGDEKKTRGGLFSMFK